MHRVSSPVIDSDQHLYETRTMWRDHIDPDRRDDALRIEDDALGYPWLRWRDKQLLPVDVQYPGQTSELGDRRERIRAGLPAEASYDEQLPREYWDASACAAQLTDHGRRRSDGVPELRAHVGTHARRRSPVAHRQHDGVEPLVRFGRGRRRRTRAPGRARHAARRRVVAHRARTPRARRRAPRDGRARARRRPPALASGSRRDLARVRRQRRDAGVPRRRSAPPVRRCVVHAARGLRRAAARVGVPLDRRRARVHRPHPQRHARTLPGPAHRRRRAQRDLGADVPDDARRRLRLHRQAQRPSARGARAPAERVLPPAGARVVVLLRAARAPHPPDRRPVHVLLGLSALRGHEHAARRLHRQRAPDRTRRRAGLLPRQRCAPARTRAQR